MIAYFTGVWPGEQAGHCCFTPDGQRPRHDVAPSPWAESPSKLYPLGDATPQGVAWPDRYSNAEGQPEGRARIVRQGGWTLVFVWDRSGDKRPGSHATFALQADLEPAEALDKARELFPRVFARIERHLGRSVVLDGGGAP